MRRRAAPALLAVAACLTLGTCRRDAASVLGPRDLAAVVRLPGERLCDVSASPES